MTTSNQVAEYGCPYCDRTDENKHTIRTHITKTTDAKHRGRNGFSKLTAIPALDEDGNEIDVIQNGGTDTTTDPSTLECDTESLTDTQQAILELKQTYPQAAKTELHEELQEEGIEVSYSYVCDVLKSHLDDDTEYEDLNDRQQTAIDALVDYKNGRFETLTAAAESIDENVSYLSAMKQRHTQIIETQQEQAEEEDRIRTESGTGTYVGPEKGIDLTHTHLSEKEPPTRESEGEATSKQADEPSWNQSATGTIYEELQPVEVKAIQTTVHELHRLYQQDSMTAERAFMIIDQLLSEVTPN